MSETYQSQVIVGGASAPSIVSPTTTPSLGIVEPQQYTPSVANSPTPTNPVPATFVQPPPQVVQPSAPDPANLYAPPEPAPVSTQPNMVTNPATNQIVTGASYPNISPTVSQITPTTPNLNTH